jgi:hypothetical protein
MRRAVLATSTVIIALVAMASVAIGDPTSEYVEKVEPICKTNKEASKRILTGVEKLVKEDKLKQAGARFTSAAAALEKAEKQLAAVPQPPESATKLGKWLSGIKGEVSLMQKIGKEFKAGNKGKGSSLVVKLKHNATTTNNLVNSFRFNYCKINPSQFH